MIKKREIILSAFLLAILLLNTLIMGAGNPNLLQNATFDEIDPSSQTPFHWVADFWQPGSSLCITSNRTHQGKYALMLQANNENDIRMIQTVNVQPHTIYKLSGWVATENIPHDKIGANLCIMGGFIHSPGVIGNTNWKQVELIFRTDNHQSKVTIGARLGFYNSTVTGTAYFADLKLVPVKNQNLAFQQIKAERPAVNPQSSIRLPSPEKKSMLAGFIGYPAIIVLFYLILLGMLWLQPQEYQEIIGSKDLSPKQLTFLFFGGAAVAFLFRLPFLGLNPSLVDLNNFKAWALRLTDTGPVGFYAPNYFCDYPPFSLYILWICGWIAKIFSVAGNQPILHFLIKFPSYVCDLATAWLLLILLRKKNPLIALFLAITYLFLPTVIYNSAYWGQMDSYYTFFMLLTFYLLIVKKQPELAIVVVVVSFLTKAQTIAFIPLLLFYLLLNYDWRRCLQTFLTALLTFILIILPFNIGKPLTWIIDVYTKQAALYPYASFYAGNFLTLLGGHAVQDSTPVIWRISYYYLGLILFLSSMIWCCFYYWRKRTKGSMAAAFTVAAFAFFLFFPRMHERYLFPVIAFLFLVAGYYKDKRLYLISILTSITCLLNMHLVIVHFQIPLPESIFNEAMYILAIVNTALFVAILLIFHWQLPHKRKIRDFFKTFTQNMQQGLLDKTKEKPFILRKSDYRLLGLAILLYCGFIFFRLGSWQMPQTGISLNSPQRGVEITFATPSDLKTIVVYHGEDPGSFQIQKFEGTNWDPVQTITCNDYYVLKRTPLEISNTEKLRLIPQPETGMLKEIAFLNRNDQLVPVKTVRFLDESQVIPANKSPLFDEQKLMTVKPSFLNSTYFDEIYHGRTAYEFVKGLPVYETTHPPLGKDLLSIGIIIFGMNPFGLRFMHVWAGILLMILLFFLGRQVLATRFGAYCTMTLGMLDFMPFVQSRYASIDTFSVLFIGLMLLFTFKYIKEQESENRPKKSWITLTLIFFAFALAVSVKWTAVYAIAGVLVCIGFIKLRQLLIFRPEHSWLPVLKLAFFKVHKPKSTEAMLEGKSKLANLDHLFLGKHLGLTILGIVVLIFIVVPVIYYLTYIPYLNTKGEEVFSREAIVEVLNNQKGMFDYHTNLTATHPFSSPWWCWPFNFKPLWLYTRNNAETGQKQSIVSMGNPLIWFLGVIAMVVLCFQLLLIRRWSIMYYAFICFFALYLPWILVTRVTFIYHFYPLLPLFYLFIAFFLENIWKVNRNGHKAVFLLLAVSFGLLILFYPVISGMDVSQNYVDFLRWFPKDWFF